MGRGAILFFVMVSSCLLGAITFVLFFTAPTDSQLALTPALRFLKLAYLQGWRASLQSGQYVWMEPSKSADECIERCRQSWTCRLVTFHHNERKCWAIQGDGQIRFSRDPAYSVLADSSKVFVKKNATSFPGQDIMVGNQRAADDTWDDTICVMLCQLHPRCNVADYVTVLGWCRLKEKYMLNPKIDYGHVSYVS